MAMTSFFVMFMYNLKFHGVKKKEKNKEERYSRVPRLSYTRYSDNKL